MINIASEKECCGCSACKQICPKHCIDLVANDEGYWYPQVDNQKCIDCGLCEKSCPVINQDEARIPLKVYAAKNKNEEIRGKSASGGIFSIVAESVLLQGGVVFGVEFDKEWNVVFGYTETIEGLSRFRRSKYVQAWVGDSYSQVRTFLKDGRLVLFTGTPCQIAGLRHFLKKDYDNLVLMDLICEGVPSPKVWQKYLNEEIARQCDKNTVLSHPISTKDVSVRDISFRNKSLGWKKYSFALTLSTTAGSGENSVLPSYINRDSAYMQAMFRYLDLRPICYECPFKKCKSGSDITIADYWGIYVLHPEMDDDKGTSMVFVNTAKGRKFYDVKKTSYIETSYEETFPYNNVVTSSKKHPNRDKFYHDLDKYDSIIELFEKYMYYGPELRRVRLKKMLGSQLYDLLKVVWHKIKK